MMVKAEKIPSNVTFLFGAWALKQTKSDDLENENQRVYFVLLNVCNSVKLSHHDATATYSLFCIYFRIK